MPEYAAILFSMNFLYFPTGKFIHQGALQWNSSPGFSVIEGESSDAAGVA